MSSLSEETMVETETNELNNTSAGTRRLAAEVIAAGGSYTEAGAAAGKSKRTIIRWMAEPGFARMVADLRAERLSEVAGRLAELAPRAVDVLAAAMESELPGERLRGAQLALEWSIRLRRAADLEARMVEIERRQGLRPTDDAEGVDHDA